MKMCYTWETSLDFLELSGAAEFPADGSSLIDLLIFTFLL